MPSWVRPPGDSPFVAAYPVLEFNVDPATIRVVTKEIRTIERTITQGEEIATGFAETKGNSTSVGTIDTNTRSGWQEHSSSVGGIEPAQVNIKIDARDVSSSLNKTMFSPKFADNQSIVTIDNTIEWVCRLTADDLEFASNASEQEEAICIALHENYMSYTASIHSGTTSLVVLEIEIADALPDEEQWALLRYAHFEHNHNTFISNEPQILISRKQNEQWVFVEQSNYKKWLQIAPFSIARLMEQEAGISSDRQQGYRLPFQQKLGSVLVTQTEQAEGGCYPQIVESEQPLVGCSHYGVNAYDFNLRDGHVILAAKDGVVGAVRTDSNRGCGSTTCAADANYIRIDRQSNDGSWISDWYLHLAYQRDPLWQVGQQVNQGDPLGIAGSTGYSTGTHLHFDVRRYLSSPDRFSDYLRNYSSGNSLKVSFDEVRQDKSSCGNDQGKLLYTNSQKEPCSYQSQQELLGFACYPPPIPTAGITPSPDSTTSLKQKITNFFEGIGRTVNGWWGKTPNDSLQARSTASSVSGCGVNQSCANQVSGRSSRPIDHSSNVSAGTCGGSGGQTNGDTLGVGGGGSGLAYNDNGGGNFTALRTWSETTTTGEGWSTSHSDVRTETEYSEITRSTVNTLVSSEAWSTATTADPTDAARLTFNYSLANTGSDLAVAVTGLRANLLIGDLPVITVNLPDRTNIEPSKAKGPFSSDSIPLTLEQLVAIDNGAPIRVVLADYGYNDSLYDTNAWGRSVLFHVDDGVADSDETFDTYLIATNLILNETYQDTLARYFPITTFDGGANDERTGTLTSITTPEYDANGEITAWVKHPVTHRAWWELSISTGGETPGIKNFKAMPAKAKTDVYLRYMVDTDGDGYTDRAERDAGTDSDDPESHPRPLLVAAKHTETNSNSAKVQLTLQNFGNFDASSVEIWAIAPDDSITIDDNLIGGGGRVRAGRRVVLGTRISTPDLTTWPTSTAKPTPSGQYDGAASATFQFRVDTAGTVGSTAGLQVSWSTDGATWTPLDVGSGYTPWTPLALSDGLSLAFSPGTVAAGETFRFETALPIDTFSYTINRMPHTPPLLVVSYNDAQGNHKFVTDVEVAQIQEDLIRYYAEMRRGLQLDVRQADPFRVGNNRAWLTLQNPSDTVITGGNLSALVVAMVQSPKNIC
ncbi:MAG: peptidoglycan DD-metalloendopeptidase family protein [Caldilineaceae bacterium]